MFAGNRKRYGFTGVKSRKEAVEEAKRPTDLDDERGDNVNVNKRGRDDRSYLIRAQRKDWRRVCRGYEARHTESRGLNRITSTTKAAR